MILRIHGIPDCPPLSLKGYHYRGRKYYKSLQDASEGEAEDKCRGQTHQFCYKSDVVFADAYTRKTAQ